MADKTKTPGEVAFRAHQAAFAQARSGFGLRTWEEFPDDIHAVWEKTAQAVREQTLDEVQAKLIAEEAYYTKHHAGWVNDYEILTDVIRIAAAPIRVP